MIKKIFEEQAIAFLSVLGHPDEDVIKRVAVADVVWSFPGSSVISGEAHGLRGVMERAATIASYQVKVDIVCAVYGHTGVAMILHNTGEKNGRVLDEHIAAVFAFREGRIARLDTYLSDVPMMEAFFS